MTLVKKSHPELRQEWAQDLNLGRNFDDLRTNSSTKVWWRCVKNPKHVWQAEVRRRTIEGNGCSYCSGLKVLEEESLAALYPKIAAEWHPTKNGIVTPFKLGPGSNKRVWWQCLTPHRHEWQATVSTRVRHGSGCRQCVNIRNPLSKAFPEIAAEWHPTKNGSLTAAGVSAGAKRHVWWQCRTDGSHEWRAMVMVRTKAKTKCPHCKRTSKSAMPMMLDAFSPELAAQWHPVKNGERKPSDYASNSNAKVWWQCPVDPTHEWEALIGNRVRFGAGCRFCALRSSYVIPSRSLAVRFPEIAKEWHPTKNGTLTPDKIAAGSSKRVWWQCRQNPEHVWDATVTTRTHPKSRGLCPSCSGHIVTDQNSLRSVHPEIAAEWHPTKNLPLTSDKISRASARVVWWKCAANSEHEWEARVKNRTILKNGCPHCEAVNRVQRLQEMLLDAAGSNTNPFQTFTQNLTALRALAKSHAPAKAALKQTFHRMLYSTAITVLETYLSDAFHQRVMGSDALIEKLLQTTPEFAERKYSLSDIIGWQRDIRNKVSEYLLGIVWHNLAKVGAMYSTMFQILFPQQSRGVYHAVLVRHDIVHRNGRKKDGTLHRIYEHDINAVFDDIESFVTAIHQELAKV